MNDQYTSSGTPCMADDVRQLLAALIRAKKNFTKTGLSGSNQHLKIKYAKISDIYNAVEEALHNEQIDIVHFRDIVGEKEVLFTRLMHAQSNQWIEDKCFLESEKPGNQGKGAALTYMRKAAVLTLCGISPEDDDGEEEQGYVREANITTTQAQELTTLLNALPADQRNKVNYNICKFNKIQSVDGLKVSAFDRVKVYILKEKEQH